MIVRRRAHMSPETRWWRSAAIDLLLGIAIFPRCERPAAGGHVPTGAAAYSLAAAMAYTIQ